MRLSRGRLSLLRQAILRHRLRVCLAEGVIICAVLAVLTSRSAPTLPTRKLDRFAAGAQIITGETYRKTLPVYSNMTAP